MDETSVYMDMVPSKTVDIKGKKTAWYQQKDWQETTVKDW